MSRGDVLRPYTLALRAFTAEQVIEMRKLGAAGVTYKAIAEKFGCGTANARTICLGVLYKDVEIIPQPERVRKGRKGKPSTQRLLSDEQVVQMRRLAAEGVPQVALAKKFGVRATIVSEVVGRRTYRDVGPPISYG